MFITDAIRAFGGFLDYSWGTLNPVIANKQYTSNENTLAEWLQLNWELLVVQPSLPAGNVLPVYGNGLLVCEDGSRITAPAVVPDYIIYAVPAEEVRDVLHHTKAGKGAFRFSRLVGFENGSYSNKPPFAYVLTHDETGSMERVWPLAQVQFVLQRV
ncbi:hypothetical protein [Deminuibacter soli]|uniref:Uncharacterized protein n=1 Tax=Deminuibacter soli TaxID=2291815 RepID=A0A3E1NCT2_9BACT|nr:hypothetical protein [Deminuibacter soli]RFM25815.1 hypothetical protein DXN05_22915 [Deminuibacter soli]